MWVAIAGQAAVWEDNLTNRNDAPLMLGSPGQDVANLVGETKVLAIHHALARSRLNGVVADATFG
jgi:hypothetical protein